MSDLLFQAILKYQKHPSIEAIQSAVSNKEPFNFSEVSEADITKEIKNLLTSKASQKSDVPTKILKENIDVYAKYVCLFFNKCVRLNIFQIF